MNVENNNEIIACNLNIGQVIILPKNQKYLIENINYLKKIMMLKAILTPNEININALNINLINPSPKAEGFLSLSHHQTIICKIDFNNQQYSTITKNPGNSNQAFEIVNDYVFNAPALKLFQQIKYMITWLTKLATNAINAIDDNSLFFNLSKLKKIIESKTKNNNNFNNLIKVIINNDHFNNFANIIAYEWINNNHNITIIKERIQTIKNSNQDHFAWNLDAILTKLKKVIYIYDLKSKANILQKNIKKNIINELITDYHFLYLINFIETCK